MVGWKSETKATKHEAGGDQDRAVAEANDDSNNGCVEKRAFPNVVAVDSMWSKY